VSARLVAARQRGNPAWNEKPDKKGIRREKRGIRP